MDSPQLRSMDVPKQRHFLLSAWLVIMIIANAATAVITPLMVGNIQQALPNFPAWLVWLIALGALLNVAFAIALFNWKKWGFFGFLVIGIITFAQNLYVGIGIPRAVFGLLGAAILYGVLQIGGQKSGWSQLE
jgi:hypothetical protein